MTRTEQLILACLRLKGGSLDREEHSFCLSVCARCKREIPKEGQEVIRAVADERGIWFKCKIPCRCGCSTGFVGIEKDEVA